MPPILDQRDKLDTGYHSFEQITLNMMANCYIARAPDGNKVFFKQFSSPSVKVRWYPGFKQYQREIRARIEGSPAKNFCYKWYDQFEGCVLKKDGTPRPGRFFSQTYEFLEGGYDMQKELDKAKGGLEVMSFVDRVISAKVMMNAIAAIHKAGVVHTDLKPENLMLVANDNPHVDAKYDVKLIDMDFALQVDKTAPWHEDTGYTGTPGWFSPEHLRKNGKPVEASDVFTCGLILYELLGGKQPLYHLDDADYLKEIDSRSTLKPTLLGRMGDLEDPGNSQIVEEVIHRCLDPDPAKRPTAKEVNEALNNEEEEGTIGGSTEGLVQPVVVRGCMDRAAENYNPAATEDDGSCRYAEPAPPVGGIREKLLLVDDASGGKLTFGVETKVGKTLLKQFGEDHRFYDAEQYVVAKDSEGFWQVIPDANAINDTMYNGKKITESARLEPGDQLAVGREEKGVIKMPLTVQQG